MQESNSLQSELARILADKAARALAVESDLEWWATLLESFYGTSPCKTQQNWERWTSSGCLP